MISVIIPLFNKEKYIHETINSVLNQSFKNLEIIIVNDGSTDKSIDIVNGFKDKRIKIYNIINSGVSNARNFGIQNATFNWLAFLDGDDIWNYSYLETVVNIIHNYTDVKVIATNYYRKYHENKKLLAFNSIPFGYIDNYFNNTCITSSSVLIEKSVFNYVGLFEPKIKYGEDQHMWLRINLKYKTFYNNIPLVIYKMTDHIYNIFNFENKDIRNDLVYHINYINSNDIKWDKYRSRYLLKNLKPYYICDNHLSEVRNLLNTVSKNNYTILQFCFYSFPRTILKTFYKKFFRYKYSRV